MTKTPWTIPDGADGMVPTSPKGSVTKHTVVIPDPDEIVAYLDENAPWPKPDHGVRAIVECAVAVLIGLTALALAGFAYTSSSFVWLVYAVMMSCSSAMLIKCVWYRIQALQYDFSNRSYAIFEKRGRLVEEYIRNFQQTPITPKND